MRDDDADSFSWSIKFMQLHLETMNVDSFRNSQQEMPNSDEQPDQEQRDVNFSPATIEAYRTNLLTTAVKDLGMNPEEDKDIGSAGTEDDLATDLAASATILSLVCKTTLMLAYSRATYP